MKKYVSNLLIATFLIFSPPIFADESDLSYTDDCAGDVVEAQDSGVPILLVFSSEECNYCERLRTEVLEPAMKNNELTRHVLIRQLDINTAGKIVDFDGDKIRTAVFVNRYNIYATPTIVIVDYEGTPLADPIVGYNDADSYRRMLTQRIEYAILAMDMQELAKSE